MYMLVYMYKVIGSIHYQCNKLKIAMSIEQFKEGLKAKGLGFGWWNGLFVVVDANED